MQRVVRALGRATSRPALAPPIPVAGLRRLLVVRPDDRVGDVLLTTPLLRALREGLPHVRIDLLLAPRRAPLLEGSFLVDKIIPYDRRRAARNPFAFAALVLALRRSLYDVAVDASHYDAFSTTAAGLTRLSGARFRIGHQRGDAAHFYSHPVPVPEGERYDVAVKLSLLSPLGLASDDYSLETMIGLGPRAAGRARRTLDELELEPGKFVLLNPGARKADRRVTPPRLAEVVRRLRAATGLASLVVFGPGEEELAREVVSLAKDAARLSPPTDLDELAALVREAALVVTGDTGPMHLAVACGAKVLALFTQGDQSRWGHPAPTFCALDGADGRDDLAASAERAATRLLDAAP